MKKRILSLLLTLVMILGLLPATTLPAFAAAGGEVYVGGVKMSDGTYLAVDATATQTTKPSGGYAYYKDGTLTLNNYSYKGKGYLNISSSYYEVIYSKNDLTLELIGNNTLTHTYSDTDLIYVDGANLTVGGDGKLTGTADNYGLYADKDITINGGTIELSTFHAGIFSCDDVIINDGDITAESEIDDGIYASCDVTINGGHVTAIGNAQAIRYDSSYSFTVAKGMEIQASTTVDGTLGEYVAAYHSTYKKIVVRPAHAIYVGDVCMDDGDYLAVGATATQTTKPSGGYAYYKDGKLTLNNYSYEGTGYQYISIGYCAIVYAKHDLTLELVGTNSLVQERENSDVICIQSEDDGGCLTIDGTGSLSATTTVGYAGIEVDGTLTVNGGTIDCAAKGSAMISRDQDIIINGGNVTASGRVGLNAPDGNVKINGGNVLATGTTSTWGAISATNFTVAEGMKIQASTTADGALGEYVASKHSNYKKIVIESPAINTVNVSATWSGTPKDATTSTTGAAVTATKWYRKSGSNWVQLGSFDTIYSEYTYRCEVTVGATGTYTLADGYTVKINGTAATKKSGNTWYRDVTITGYTSYVDVYDIALPEAFTKPDFTYNDEEGAAYHWDVVQVEWFECDKDGHILSDALPADHVFEKGGYYRVEVTVVPETNWQFHGSQLSFYINGKAAMPLYGYNKAYPDSVTGYLVYNTADIEGDYELFVYDDSLSGSAKNIYIKDGQYLGSNATGATSIKPASGGYAYYKDGVLELNGYDNEKAHFIFEELALELYLVGDNTIGAIYDNEFGMAGGNLETRQGNLIIDAADGGKLTIASNPLDAYANIQVKDLYFNGGELTSCLANGTYGAAVQLNGGNLYLEDGYEAYVSDTNDFASATKWDGKTDIDGYDCVWIVEEQATVTHTVTFKVDTTTVATKTVEDGKTVTAPADPTQSGKTFLGWFSGNTKFDFTTPITGDITLTAKFEDVVSGESYIVGDVNGDNEVNIMDATILLRYINGWPGYDQYIKNMDAADVSRDGNVLINDATILLRYANNWSGYDQYIFTVNP